MSKIELVDAFQDTLNISKQFDYDIAKKVRVIKECFKSFQLNLSYYRTQFNGKIIVENNTTFSAANKYKKYGKTAVLNFANPVNPGGGVATGAMAQEECLCRSSNLYLSLQSPIAIEEYYNYNMKNTNGYFFTDRIVYSESITVFKSDDDIPMILPQNDWFNVDVITCAAPYLGNSKYIDKEILKEVFKHRIKNIFESAIDHEIDVIILGAFGCGAFKNPPEIVAQAFHEVITENNYNRVFKFIVFAIKSSINNASENDCPNITAFKQEFNEHEFSKREKIELTCFESLDVIDIRNNSVLGKVVNGKYIIDEKISYDYGFTLYLAHDKNSKKYSVKVRRKNHSNQSSSDKIISIERSLMVFDHPYIPKVYDIIEDETYYYIVKDYLTGITLRDLIKEKNHLSEKEVVEIALKVSDVLNYLNSFPTPIIFGNINPNTIIISDPTNVSGNIKIIEIDPEKRKGCTELMGVVGYCPPEQYGGLVPLDHRVDIYGLGVTMHYMITGVNPCEPPYELWPIRQYNPDLSKGLEYIIEKCIQRDREDRYSNFSELIHDLNNYDKLPKRKKWFFGLFKK